MKKINIYYYQYLVLSIDDTSKRDITHQANNGDDSDDCKCDTKKNIVFCVIYIFKFICSVCTFNLLVPPILFDTYSNHKRNVNCIHNIFFKRKFCCLETELNHDLCIIHLIMDKFNKYLNCSIFHAISKVPALLSKSLLASLYI